MIISAASGCQRAVRQQSQCPKSPNIFVLEKLVWNLNISRQSLGMTMQHTLRGLNGGLANPNQWPAVMKKKKSYPHRDELKLDHHCCGRESRRTLWKRFSPTSKLGVIQTWLSALVTQKFIMIMFYKWSHQSKNLLHQTCCTAAQLFFSAASFNPDWLPPNSF